jgi:molecular chaperone HscB
MICWSCEREAGSGPLCGSCAALLPPDEGADHFQVLGLAPGYAVDLAAVEAAYKQVSRLVHPDRFATADPRARRASLARTVQLNEAWRTLRDPVRRAEYLLRRAGVDVGSHDGDKKVPPVFLMEILELHEELKEAQRAGDAVKVAALTGSMRQRAADTMKTIAAGLEDGTPGRLDEAAHALIALRYYNRFLDEIAAHEERQETLEAQREADHG